MNENISEIIKYLGKNEIQELINKNIQNTSSEFILKNSGKHYKFLREIAEQINSKKKAIKKLPKLSKNQLLYKKIPLEQSSSELTAEIKLNYLDGEKIADLTGGLGIDSIHFSKKFEEVYYFELNKELFYFSKYNFSNLGIMNIKQFNNDSIKLLEKYPENYFDWIFVDPARRNDGKRSVDINFMTPNVYEHFSLLSQKSKKLMFKLAPAFDLTEAKKLFPTMSKFISVSVNGELKETILLFTEKDTFERESILIKNNNSIKFSSNSVTNNERLYSNNCQYLYVPDPSIIRTHLLIDLASKMNLGFTNQYSIFLFSDELKDNFIGKIYKCKFRAKYNTKKFKNYLRENNIKNANLIRSAFPLSPIDIAKKHKIKQAGMDFIFFTKDKDNNLIFIHALRAN